MVNYETVSAKIPHELKEKVNKYDISITETIRQALEQEVEKKELEELKKRSEKLKPLFEKVTTKEVVKLIREDRDSR
jgi:antitoxin CcdA